MYPVFDTWFALLHKYVMPQYANNTVQQLTTEYHPGYTMIWGLTMQGSLNCALLQKLQFDRSTEPKNGTYVHVRNSCSSGPKDNLQNRICTWLMHIWTQLMDIRTYPYVRHYSTNHTIPYVPDTSLSTCHKVGHTPEFAPCNKTLSPSASLLRYPRCLPHPVYAIHMK